MVLFGSADGDADGSGSSPCIQRPDNHALLLQMPSQVPLAELTIGIGKAFAFGAAVSTVSCYYGLRSRADTTSLAAHTTSAVVASIVSVLLLDAGFAILLTDVG